MKKSGRFVDRLIFKISDVEIDLTRRSRDKREEGIRERVLRSDAPINAIAMSADGKVLAHPDFVRHAKDGVYEIREDLNNNQYNAARTRYERLSKAYPDWALVC
jgi:phosphoribosyl-dephospho-CoA transferase